MADAARDWNQDIKAIGDKIVALTLLQAKELGDYLKEAGGNKIAVIKEVRGATGLGLKEAKDLVDGAPKNIKEALDKAGADELKKKLEAAGAKVEIKAT